MDWKIWYESGETFDSTMGEPHEAPPDGVLVVAYTNTREKSAVTGINAPRIHRWDWYLWRKDMKQWLGCDAWGLVDQVKHNFILLGAVIQGRNAANEVFDAVYKAAMEDEEFPRMSGVRPGMNGGQNWGDGETV